MSSDPSQAAALIAAKRAEVLAKLARFQNSNAAPTRPVLSPPVSTPPPPTPSTQQNSQPSTSSPASGLSLSEIQRKKNEVMNRIKAGGLQINQRNAAPPPMPLDASGNFDLRAMLDKGIIPKRETELKASTRSPTSTLKQSPTGSAKTTPPSATSKPATLKIESTPESFKDPTKNPYYDPSLPVNDAPKGRRARPSLRFVQPGKYIEKANQERAKAQLERLKEEVAAKVRQAGMEAEMDISDKTLKKEAPPVAEWWDVPFLPSQDYQDLNIQVVDPQQLTSLITSYVHHPVPIQAPSEMMNGKPPSRALMLTKKERKKLRRQRRNETQKDKQDKIRLGLLPPDPPKVKISNLMKVLGDAAIQDPTKVEAKVRKEMEERQKQHEKANEQRKLTPAERREKLKARMTNDQNTGNEVAVFKIKNCSHPKHKYKIEKNAQQFGLTGIVIVHHKCHMVIVEGGPKSIKAYKKLMLRRIDWNDMPAPRNVADMDVDQDTSNSNNNSNNMTDGENKCYLVWNGQVKNKAFKKFTWKSFESEKMARLELTKWHAENYWDAALMATDEELAMRQPDL